MPGAIDFSSILSQYQETVTLIHREETSQDAYGEPVWTETTEEVSAHFQIIKQTDPLQTEGVKTMRLANLFLPLDQEFGLLDQVEAERWPGIRWAVMGEPYISHLQKEVMLQEVVPQ